MWEFPISRFVFRDLHGKSNNKVVDPNGPTFHFLGLGHEWLRCVLFSHTPVLVCNAFPQSLNVEAEPEAVHILFAASCHTLLLPRVAIKFDLTTFMNHEC